MYLIIYVFFVVFFFFFFFFFSSRRRHTSLTCDWSSDVCSPDLTSATHKLIGTVELGVRFADSWIQVGKSFPYLSNLAVHPHYRRHGVASRLLVSCQQVSQEWGFRSEERRVGKECRSRWLPRHW